jgi:phosphotransferase system HPr (HPr) family protein
MPTTIKANVIIQDPIGLHARPAGQIVKLIKEAGLEVRIGKVGEELVRANSPLRMMALKAKTGQELVVEIDTEDQALADSIILQIQDFIKG